MIEDMLEFDVALPTNDDHDKFYLLRIGKGTNHKHRNGWLLFNREYDRGSVVTFGMDLLELLDPRSMTFIDGSPNA